MSGRAGRSPPTCTTSPASTRSCSGADGDRTVASSLEGVDGAELPDRGEREIGGRRYRVTSFTAPAFEGRPARITVRLLSDERDTQTNITSDSLIVGALLAAFLVFAFAFALMVSRSLQAQIQRLLEAARAARRRRVLGQGADRGQRRVRRARQRVQRDGAPARGAGWRSSSPSARACSTRSAASASRSPRAWTATRCCEIVVQTAVDGVGRRDAGARACASTPGGADGRARARSATSTRFAAALQAAEAAVLDTRRAGRGRRSAGDLRGRAPAARRPTATRRSSA